MSLITACPNCGTMFRVVPDQLKISEGWVRCGHCAEIFDATAHLQDESVLTESAAARQVSRPPALEERTRPAALDEFTRPATLEDQSSPPADLPTAPGDLQTRPAPLESEWPTSVTPSQLPPDSRFRDSRFPDSQSLEPSPLDRPFVFRTSDVALQGAPDSVLPTGGRASRPMAYADEPTAAELGKVSFVRQARRKAFWKRPFVRIGLAFVSLLLAALLLVQAAYQDRDRLALAEPALLPALVQMCELLQCTLGPPRQIEAIVIESSGFNRLRNNSYRLAFTLRNTAPVPVATPSIELTITDSQDQTIARRVLTPAELGADAALAPSAEWSRAVGLALDGGGTTRVAGYRLLAFYP